MRGQAATEYLMTYGWAIFALLLVVAVLLYSGMLSPTYLISEECNFGNNFPCNIAMYNEGGETKLAINIFNGFPYPVAIMDMHIETTDGGQLKDVPFYILLESGANQSFVTALEDKTLTSGDIERFIGNITYVSCASEIGEECSTNEHVVTGRITARLITE